MWYSLWAILLVCICQVVLHLAWPVVQHVSGCTFLHVLAHFWHWHNMCCRRWVLLCICRAMSLLTWYVMQEVCACASLCLWAYLTFGLMCHTECELQCIFLLVGLSHFWCVIQNVSGCGSPFVYLSDLWLGAYCSMWVAVLLYTFEPILLPGLMCVAACEWLYFCKTVVPPHS